MKKTKQARGNKTAVTFEMPADVKAKSLFVVGDFNEWNTSGTPLKHRKDGTWSVTLNLAPGTYRYRYVSDGDKWYNDPEADSFEASGFGEDNSVVVVQ